MSSNKFTAELPRYRTWRQLSLLLFCCMGLGCQDRQKPMAAPASGDPLRSSPVTIYLISGGRWSGNVMLDDAWRIARDPRMIITDSGFPLTREHLLATFRDQQGDDKSEIRLVFRSNPADTAAEIADNINYVLDAAKTAGVAKPIRIDVIVRKLQVPPPQGDQ